MSSSRDSRPNGTEGGPATASEPRPAEAPARSRSAWFYMWTLGGGFLLLIVLLAAGLLLYASTPQFANIVRKKIITVLQDSTGGRVELHSFHWNLWHLAIQADDLTIHGLEGPGETPYVHVDRLYIQAEVLAFLRPQVGLSRLEAEHPVFHLIVYPDGSTNQPRPKSKPQSNQSLGDTIFDLKIRRVEINRGVAILNQRSVPFNLAARDLGAVVTYLPASDHYLGRVQAADLRLQGGSAPALNSTLALEVEVARNAAQIRSLHFSSGGSHLEASGAVQNFAEPAWRLAARGNIDLREVAALTGVDGLRQGAASLNLTGEGSGSTRFSLGGDLRIVDGGYRDNYVVLSGVNATTHLLINPTEIALEGVKGSLREGGSVDATLRIAHWNKGAATSPETPLRPIRGKPVSAVQPAFTIQAVIHAVRLPTVLRAVAVRQFQNLGFDTAATGAVDIAWTGPADDLTVSAGLQLTAPRFPVAGELPLSGMVDAKYFQRNGTVEIRRFEAHTLSTSAGVSGSLAVYPITRSSALQVDLSTTSLGEFDRVLTDLGLTLNGRSGVAALPVQLHGQAEFNGTAGGSLMDPDIKGHLTAANFSLDLSAFGPTAPSSALSGTLSRPSPGPLAGASVRSIHWDHVDAVGEYSSALISVQQASLVAGGARVDLHGTVAGHPISRGRSAFDDFSRIEATANIHQAPLTDLLAIVGQSLPITGTVSLQMHAGGTLGDLNGGGNLAVLGGEMANEPYRSISADLSFAGHSLNLVKLTLLQQGGAVVANGTYDLRKKNFLANLDGTNFELARFRHLQTPSFPVTGSLKFDAHASGSFTSPSVLLGIHLSNLTLGGEPAGGIEAVANTQSGIAHFTAHSAGVTTRIELSGQTALHDDFQTQAKLVFSEFDIDPFLRIMKVQNLTGHSLIAGRVELAGPAREPKRFSGDAEIDRLALTMENVTLGSEGPLRASFRDGVVRVTQAHIVGPDTNMTITGAANVMGKRDLNLRASGSVNMRLAETLDPDINSSGHVDFNVEAAGTLTKPSLTGQVRLTNVAMALNDVSTGISRLNGTLVFDQDRLEVQQLVGTTGGGQLKLAGFITYQNGIYGDLTATGKDIRIRYSGISATADTTLHLQGSQANMLFSGNVVITRFIIGPNLDFAAFTAPPAAAPPPSLNAPSNRVRLDIRVTSAPQLDFQNSYAQLAGSVDLRIRGTVAQPALLGRINITEGTANFAGTTYQLQHGEIYFTNPVRIEPVIDIDATTRIQEYDVTVGLHGSTAHLTPTFRSEPPLPQADVISLLALGRTQQDQQIYSQDQEQAGVNSTTNALLGGALNATVSSRVQKLFGVGSVKIDPTYLANLGNSTARITVQQNISRNVELTYATNVNATAEQLIQAQVNLTANISILAIRDESDVFSVVLKVHRRLR
ncbi:MAG TPA: translocation/assembly module TamB domain-containing protein [Acidobacteriaceae bacterium]|nr:translocation/assembly module TamB domain-containing protein [Acidobacteriaceae bacterium]